MDNRKRSWVTVAITLAVFGLVGYIFLDTAKEKAIVFEDDRLIISGIFGAKVDREEIESVTLVDHIPEILYKTNGASVGNIRLRLFKLESIERAHLTVMDKSAPPFVLISSKIRPHYINFTTKEKTLQTYEAISAWAQGK